MRNATILATLIVLFGCKNQEPRASDNVKPELNIIKKPKVKSVYKWIAQKQEYADSLPKNFDFSKNYTNSEVKTLQLDTAKIGHNEYYFLSDQKFLNKTIDSISFLVYFKHKYGDQLEKILRVQNTDTIFDLTLSMRGGDGQDIYAVSSEFVNDSLFRKIERYEQTVKDNTHSMAYEVDSIVTLYRYNPSFDLIELEKDTFQIREESATYYESLKGKSFKVWNQPFKINGLQCKWEYEVEYTDNTTKDSKKVLVNLLGQRLVELRTKKIVLELDLEQFMFIYNPIDISRLDGNKYTSRNKYRLAPYTYTNDSTDVNLDGYHDFYFFTESAGGGANEGYLTYLYNPVKKGFQYSGIFSGYNMKFDPEKNRVSFFSKSGVDNYHFYYINLKEDRISVASKERVHHYVDTIFYRKLIDEKVVLEKKIVLKEHEGWTKYLERN